MITITRTPAQHNSVYRAIVFECTSNATANDLQVKCELFVQGSSVLSIWSSKIDGKFTFELSGLLHAFMEHSHTVLNGSIGTFDLQGNALPFYCVFTEYYNNSIGILNPYASITSSTYKANAINLKYYDSNFDNYILGNNNKSFLTNAPNNLKIRAIDKPQLFFITNESEVVVVMEQILMGESSNTIYAKTLTNGFGGFLLEVLNPNAKYIDVWVETTGEERISEIRRYVIHNSCKATRIEWLNDLGGLDAYNFIGEEIIQQDVERTEISKYLPSDYTPDFHQTINQQAITKERVQVNSDFVSPQAAAWLSEINRSKMVWLNDNGIRKAIRVVGTSTLVKDKNNLVQFNLEFELMPFYIY